MDGFLKTWSSSNLLYKYSRIIILVPLCSLISIKIYQCEVLHNRGKGCLLEKGDAGIWSKNLEKQSRSRCCSTAESLLLKKLSDSIYLNWLNLNSLMECIIGKYYLRDCRQFLRGQNIGVVIFPLSQ